ncbi:hypothetical protein AS888_20855 [Peribacillus simplex]|uniref:Uncharacterized protein n=1 Tax=Peribacillus simplex TaxID=1478 RepID=A0A125QRU0_9BACI|nr:hypothetical protein [Peribacillus simplex]KWW17963.1 hypothetical protein AS888_20855 [Peribacillus simplex]
MKRNDDMFRIPIIEVILSMISSWWAVVLFNSPDLFNRLPNTYEFFGNIAKESHWGLLFLTAAIVKIMGIVLKNRWMRKIGLFLSALVYSLIAAAYFLGMGWFSVGFGTFSAISIMALWGIREVEIRNG